MMHALSILVALLCIGGAGGCVALMIARRNHQAALRRMEEMLEGPSQATVQSKSGGMELPLFLTTRLVRAGWEPTRRQVMALVGVLLAAMLGSALFAGPLAALVAGATLVLIGFAILEHRGAANMRLLSESMLGLLDRIRQLLSVGNTLSVALQRAAENSPPAVTRCLASTIRRINNGGGVAESIERCAADLDLYELHLLATATRTNLRFGGSMTTILKNIIENIRKRAAIERELRSNTTQIRASAWVLALLPMLVGSIVLFTNRDYGHWFLVTEAGHKMIAYAIVSQFLGAMCMRFIIKTRF